MPKQITIVGAGALGSHVALFLRNLDALIKVIDFDHIEKKNLLSQFHIKGSLGRNKAEALKQVMNFNWGIKIEAVPHKLTKDNADVLLKGGDLVIDCLDNGEARQLVQGSVNAYLNPATGQPYMGCLHGALAPDGQFARVLWSEHFKIDDGAAGAATCEDGEFLPFIATTAALMAQVAQQYLKTGKKIGYQIHPGGIERI